MWTVVALKRHAMLESTVHTTLGLTGGVPACMGLKLNILLHSCSCSPSRQTRGGGGRVAAASDLLPDYLQQGRCDSMAEARDWTTKPLSALAGRQAAAGRAPAQKQSRWSTAASLYTASAPFFNASSPPPFHVRRPRHRRHTHHPAVLTREWLPSFGAYSVVAVCRGRGERRAGENRVASCPAQAMSSACITASAKRSGRARSALFSKARTFSTTPRSPSSSSRVRATRRS